ncbi:helix-turn-helix domain-containing protein [Streptacidiphilus sp. ASG 303]|uniref:helix-turn-helix domain-containing protein n=1 Tax=Streptacidiphilus sp. ASG 303 TaxID=2896847 RepID=UPI001E2A8BE7|nr:helix-turn-helix domain-containing protein [Streptacidiphilus sp. ASG 303]MCD0485925.1 helix-turn-helix domain-containing protein [Streptacidiphilus sp. ASG 303]
MRLSADPRDDVFGLACWQGPASLMDHAHRHDDIEVNLAAGSELVYLFGGRRVVLERGAMAAFWAAVPHQLVGADPGTPVRWLTVPLAVFLRWGLPDHAVQALLRGQPLVAGAADRQEADAALFRQWSADLADGDGELRRITLLEIEARLRRLVAAASAGRRDGGGAEDGAGRGGGPEDAGGAGAGAGTGMGADGAVERAARMARFVALHFREPLTAERIAAAVPLHPHYAMGLFREVVGTTLTAYVTQCRVAEAQRLLVTTAMPVAEVGEAAGFGSQSRFYSCFTEACGMPPAAYRRLHHAAARGAGGLP